MHYMHYSKAGRIYDNHIIINRMLERLVTMYIDINFVLVSSGGQELIPEAKVAISEVQTV